MTTTTAVRHATASAVVVILGFDLDEASPTHVSRLVDRIWIVINRSAEHTAALASCERHVVSRANIDVFRDIPG